MSIAGLKRAVDTLSIEERRELLEYLRRSFRQNDLQWQSEIGRRLDACLQGRGYTADYLLSLHDRRSSAGQ